MLPSESDAAFGRDAEFYHAHGAPIAVAHAIKTAFAGFEEYDALDGHADREYALLAPLRSSSPIATCASPPSTCPWCEPR